MAKRTPYYRESHNTPFVVLTYRRQSRDFFTEVHFGDDYYMGRALKTKRKSAKLTREHRETAAEMIRQRCDQLNANATLLARELGVLLAKWSRYGVIRG